MPGRAHCQRQVAFFITSTADSGGKTKNWNDRQDIPEIQRGVLYLMSMTNFQALMSENWQKDQELKTQQNNIKTWV